MWQYQNTDELVFKVNIDDSIFHSDHYLGTDYSDGIKHWKYIKKEKTANGKWRYIYSDKVQEEYNQLIKDQIDNANKYNKMADRAKKAGLKYTEESLKKDVKDFYDKADMILEARTKYEQKDKLRKKIAHFMVLGLNDISNQIDKGKEWLKKKFK